MFARPGGAFQPSEKLAAVTFPLFLVIVGHSALFAVVLLASLVDLDPLAILGALLLLAVFLEFHGCDG